jgi:hypothetical protein
LIDRIIDLISVAKVNHDRRELIHRQVIHDNDLGAKRRHLTSRGGPHTRRPSDDKHSLAVITE